MAIRVDTANQAVYIHEPLGHTVPALNTAWTVAGLYRVEADVNQDSLIVALYGETNYLSSTLNWVGLYMNADGINCRLEGRNGPSAAVTSGNYLLEVGRDYRIAIDYNGSGTVRMLLDGVVALTLSFTPNAGIPGERSTQLGGYGDIAGYTDCTIARWRMWTAVLSEAEHRAEYRSLAPVRTSGLIHNWPMNAGSGRFADTVSGQPDMADNPAVPCGDGTAFVYRPSIIGTPQFFDLGQTATPGAQSVTVPTYAERVLMFFNQSDDAGTPDASLSSLTSNFAGTFTIDNAVSSSVAQAVAVATATVTVTGAGRTFTPVMTATNPVAGAGCWVVFLQDVLAGSTIATNKAQATGAGATAGTASAAGVLNGLAIAADTRLDATGGNYPANQSGWTSLNTGQTTGAFTYWASSRIRQKAITATGTETATTQNTNGSCIALATVQAKVLAGYEITVTPGSYSLTGASARTLAGRLSRVTPGSYALTGSSARTLYARRALVTPGSYLLTGSSGALVYSRPLVVTPGSYSITGSDGALSAGLLVNVTPGSYAVSGADVELVYTPVSPALEINVTPGSYGFTGADGTLLKSSVLNVTPGVYSLSGSNAGLLVGKLLSVSPGAYSLTGSDASLLASKALSVDPGAYSVTGSNVELEYVTPNKELIVTPGAYLFTGYPVELVYSGEQTGSPHGFVITDTAPKLWWQRKPKALDEEEAEQKVAQVVRVVERIALSQVKAEQPAPAKEQKREVREAIAPLVAEMPGFDWMTLYRVILIELGRRQQEQQAAELAQIEIARIQAMRRDEDDVLILLMSL